MELTSLLRRAAMGDESIIAHDREPIARLLALAPRGIQRLGLDEAGTTTATPYPLALLRQGLV